jgi:hypothetical protein
MLIVALTTGLAAFHALMLGIFAALHGAPSPSARRRRDI